MRCVFTFYKKLKIRAFKLYLPELVHTLLISSVFQLKTEEDDDDNF